MTQFRGQDPEEVDNSGTTALMIACETNRPHNVELLLKKAKEGESWSEAVYLEGRDYPF